MKIAWMFYCNTMWRLSYSTADLETTLMLPTCELSSSAEARLTAALLTVLMATTQAE